MNTESLTQPGEGVVGVRGDGKAGCNRSKLDRSEIDDGEIGGGKVDDKVRKKGQKTSKSKKSSKSKKTVGSSNFLTFKARLAFTELRQTFVKAPILHHFDPERHIRVETDTSGYAIGGVLSQLTSDDLGQWYLVTFFFQKMILAKTRYETHNDELLTIIEAFKTWKKFLEGS